MTLPPTEVRGRGSQLGSGPCPIGPSTSGLAFRVMSFTGAVRFSLFLFDLLLLSLLECDLPAPFCQWSGDDEVEHRPNSRAGGLEAHPAVHRGEWRGEQGDGSEAFPSRGGAPRSVAGTVAEASALAAIPVLTVEVASEVTLAAPPPPTAAEEERETELPTSPGGGLQGSPL